MHSTRDIPACMRLGWGGCSESCGGGSQSKSYSVTAAASGGGTACPSPTTMTQSCNTQACVVNCAGSWGGWGSCSESCGGGSQSRSYSVATAASGGGTACPSPTTVTQSCNTGACAVDCAGSWGSWGSCSESCGSGIQSRSYSVATAASGGGISCPSVTTMTQVCNTQACVAAAVDCAGSWGEWGECR